MSIAAQGYPAIQEAKTGRGQRAAPCRRPNQFDRSRGHLITHLRDGSGIENLLVAHGYGLHENHQQKPQVMAIFPCGPYSEWA